MDDTRAIDAERFAPQHFHTDLGAAYVRGRLGGALPPGLDDLELCVRGNEAGLRLHRFKRTHLARVQRVLGTMQSLAPARVLDIGSGRGAFLWPLLGRFPHLRVTATDADPKRVEQIAAVAAGGVERLTAAHADVTTLPFADGDFDVVCVLEVLEHLTDPAAAAREVVRVARSHVVASVPLHEDNNPQHLNLFSTAALDELLCDAGATHVNFEYVPGHMIAVARVGP
jgi:2-polyprenyl-3-methyl-5-hydroxy-6-metoxy-1,4-benzoquinol methylase